MGALNNANENRRAELLEHITALKGDAPDVKGVIAALDNADTSYVLLEVLKTNPQKVMEGINIAAHALGTNRKILYLPETEVELAETFKETGETFQTEIKAQFLDVRSTQGYTIISLMTAVELADTFESDYQPGIYMSVNGASVKKFPLDVKLNEITDLSNAKAILAGYRLYKPEAGEKMLYELNPTNGVIQVLTEKNCIVAEAEKCLLESRKQSCGKCVFCREGLIQLQYMQKEIMEGRGKAEYLELTKEIGEAMNDSAACSLGQLSAEIALSAVEQFVEEYEAHIKKKNCPAGVCSSFVNIYIDPTSCSGCGDCVDVCPKDCIEGKNGYIHMIDDFDCTKCGCCVDACEEGAIKQSTGKLPKLPNKLTKVGRFKRR